MLLDHLYGGMDAPELKIIDMSVCHLRKRLTRVTGRKHYIETFWGRGYRMRDPDLWRGNLDRGFSSCLPRSTDGRERPARQFNRHAGQRARKLTPKLETRILDWALKRKAADGSAPLS